MKNYSVGKALLALLLVIVGRNIWMKVQTETMELNVTQDEKILEEPLMTFGSDLFEQVRDADKNVIFSPISVHMALNMVLMGTETGSESEKELIQALGYSKLNGLVEKVHESYAKVIAKFKGIAAERKVYEALPEEKKGDQPPTVDLWTAALTKGPHEPLPEYLERVERYYNSSVHPVSCKMEENVELLETVNSWAKKAGFKSDVLKPEDLAKEFSMMLMSAVQVESLWDIGFAEERVDELFYNYGKKDQLVREGAALMKIDVSMRFAAFSTMKSRNKHSSHVMKEQPKLYEELAALEFRSIEIPLRSGLTYTIIEPFDAAEGKGLEKLEEALLTQSRLSKLLQVMDAETERQLVMLQMPPFKFENDIDLKDHLRSMGVSRIFEESNSGITKMFPLEHYVSAANHKAVIEVHKNGLKAAAVTSIYFSELSFPGPSDPSYVINNPYMFIVRLNKLPLFFGHLVKI